MNMENELGYTCWTVICAALKVQIHSCSSTPCMNNSQMYTLNRRYKRKKILSMNMSQRSLMLKPNSSFKSLCVYYVPYKSGEHWTLGTYKCPPSILVQTNVASTARTSNRLTCWWCGCTEIFNTNLLMILKTNICRVWIVN